jgi:hypothetical protein
VSDHLRGLTAARQCDAVERQKLFTAKVAKDTQRTQENLSSLPGAMGDQAASLFTCIPAHFSNRVRVAA